MNDNRQALEVWENEGGAVPDPFRDWIDHLLERGDRIRREYEALLAQLLAR